jgi:hypothetical protein
MNQHDTMKALYRLHDRGAVMSGGFQECSNAASILRRAAGTLSRLAELRCNGVQVWDSAARQYFGRWNDDDESATVKKEERAEKLARDAVAALFGDSVAVTFQGDPRGAPIRLFIGAASESASPDAVIY